MKIEVERFISDSDTTVSHIKIDGKFECFGLEDEYRLEHIRSEFVLPENTIHNMPVSSRTSTRVCCTF